VVPRDIVTARMSYLCDIREVPALRLCLNIVDGLLQEGDLTVTISQADVEATAQRAVRDSFDTAWCRY
jgi:hypothetical protein